MAATLRTVLRTTSGKQQFLIALLKVMSSAIGGAAPRDSPLLVGGPCVIVLILATMTAQLEASEQQRPEKLLDSYSKTTASLTPVHLRIMQTGYVKDGNPMDQERLAGTTHKSLYHMPGHWKLREEIFSIRRQGTELKEYRSATEYVVGTELLRIYKSQRLRTPLTVSASIKPDPVKINVFKFLLTGAFIFGFDTDGVLLSQKLRQAKNLQVLPKTEIIDGFKTLVVTGHVDSRVYTLWLDPNCGCLPRQMEVRLPPKPANAEHSSDAPKGRRRQRRRSADSRPPPKWRLIRYENIHIENRSGRFIITAFDQRPISYYETGPETNRRSEYRVEHVDFDPRSWPADTFSPTIEIPNGTPVAVEEEPTIYYAWNDGKIEKTIDPALLRQPALKFQAPARKRTRLILLLVVNALLAAGALYWFIRSRRGKQSP